MRDKILDIAEEMVQDSGFDAVSYQKIAKDVGLSKTTIFHHFPNKETLALSLVQRCQTKYESCYGLIIESDRPAPEKLLAIIDAFELGLHENRLCLLGAMAHSLPALTESVQQEMQTMVQLSIERYGLVFQQGLNEKSLAFEGEANDTAAGFLAMLEGLQVLARANKKHAMLRHAAEGYVNAIST